MKRSKRLAEDAQQRVPLEAEEEADQVSAADALRDARGRAKRTRGKAVIATEEEQQALDDWGLEAVLPVPVKR